jgi:hypothetical protein
MWPSIGLNYYCVQLAQYDSVHSPNTLSIVVRQKLMTKCMLKVTLPYRANDGSRRLERQFILVLPPPQR